MPTLGTPLAPDLINPGSCWQLLKDLNGYARASGESLATQAAADRSFRVITPVDKLGTTRIRVQLLEDGYPCWLNMADLVGQARATTPPRPRLLRSEAIAARIPAVLAWLEVAAARPNHYLWGGTLALISIVRDWFSAPSPVPASGFPETLINRNASANRLRFGQAMTNCCDRAI